MFDALIAGRDVLYPARPKCRAVAAAYPLGIASGALKPEIVPMLRRRGLDDTFASSCRRTTRGPDEAGARSVSARRRSCTASPRRCLAIEDSRWGIESASGRGRLPRLAVTPHLTPRRSPPPTRDRERRGSTRSRQRIVRDGSAGEEGTPDPISPSDPLRAAGTLRTPVACACFNSPCPSPFARPRAGGRGAGRAMNAPGDDSPPAAFAIARVEYPALDPRRT